MSRGIIIGWGWGGGGSSVIYRGCSRVTYLVPWLPTDISLLESALLFVGQA